MTSFLSKNQLFYKLKLIKYKKLQLKLKIKKEKLLKDEISQKINKKYKYLIFNALLNILFFNYEVIRKTYYASIVFNNQRFIFAPNSE